MKDKIKQYEGKPKQGFSNTHMLQEVGFEIVEGTSERVVYILGKAGARRKYVMGVSGRVPFLEVHSLARESAIRMMVRDFS